MKSIYWTGIFLFFFAVGTANNGIRTSTGIKTEINNTSIEIQFLSSKIVRVLKYPKDSVLDKKSLSVTKIPEKLNLKITDDGNFYIVSSDKLEVKLDRKTATVSFF